MSVRICKFDGLFPPISTTSIQNYFEISLVGSEVLDMFHLTRDIFFLFFFPFLSVCVRFGVGAAIRKRREIYCLPYVGKQK